MNLGRRIHSLEVLIDGTWHRYDERQISVEGKIPVPSSNFPMRYLGLGSYPIKLNGIEQTVSGERPEYHYWVKTTYEDDWA